MKILVIVKVALIFASVYQKKPSYSSWEALDCKKYHSGTFRITASGRTTVIKRYGNRQFDYIDGSKSPDAIFYVSWKNPCTYVLTPAKEMLKKKPAVRNQVLTVEIIQQNTSSFTEVISANYTKAKTNCEVYPVIPVSKNSDVRSGQH